MLDRVFMRRFFDQVQTATPEQLDERIAQVETVKKTCERGSEGHADASFMLKHLRRERLERVLKPEGIRH